MENRLASFCWGRGRKVASGEARPNRKMCQLSSNVCVVFFPGDGDASCLKEFVFVCFPSE